MHIILKHLFIFIFAIVSMVAKAQLFTCGMVPQVVDCVVIMAIK